MLRSEYDQLSTTMPSSTTDDVNATLESLGETSKDSDDETETLKIPRRYDFYL